MANRYFVFFQLKAVRKPWWNHKPLPFVFTKHFFPAIESFYRPLVISNLSFIFTETFRWQIFYTVNYRRQWTKDELPISNAYYYQASWLFQELCLLPSIIECKRTFSCLAIYGVFSSRLHKFFDKKLLNSTFFSISWSNHKIHEKYNSVLIG